MKKNIIIVRGGGDIATGTIYKLHQSGYPVLVTEIANPSAIRRQVAFSEAVYEKSYTVEGVTCYFAENLTRAYELLKQRKVALMIDPDGAVIREVKPAAVVDGILAKKNLGTTMDMAPFTVALGPGFTAGEALGIGIFGSACTDLRRGWTCMRLLRQCADISLAELFMREMRFRIPGFRVLSQVLRKSA